MECLKIINNNNKLNKFNKPIDLIMWIPIIIMKQCSFNLHRIRIYRILRIKLFNPKMKFKNYSSLFAMVTLIILNTFVNSFQYIFKYLLLKNVIIPKANHLFIGTSLFYLCQLCDFSVAFLEFSFHLNLLSHLCSIINKESVGHFAYLKLSHFLISEF